MEIIHLPICHSTNDYLASTNYPSGTVVWTTHQTHGRGQRGNIWESEPDKNLMFSYLWKVDHFPSKNQFFLNIAASLAIRDTLVSIAPDIDCKVKWPNDVLVGHKKICGILVETVLAGEKIEQAIIGIGLNVNQIFESEKRISLAEAQGRPYQIDKVLMEVVEKLEFRLQMLKHGELSKLKSDYYAALYLYQEEALYDCADTGKFRGTIVGITEEGRLAISDGLKIRKFASKELSFLSIDFFYFAFWLEICKFLF